MSLEPLQAASRWLGENRQSMVAEVIELCNQNSFSDNLEGLRTVAGHLMRLMADIPVPCVMQELPRREWVGDSGESCSLATGPALRWDGWQEQGAGLTNRRRRVLLTIHYDTVYPINHSVPVCRLEDDDRLLGPGVIDAKGGIVVLRWAILAGLRYGLLDNVDWSIILTPDEEIGSPSSMSLWKEVAPKFDFALLFEPTLSNGALVDRRKGTGNYHFLVCGRSAHSGRDFQAGRNAIVQASRLAVELHSLNGQCDGVTVNVGRVMGGGALNVVPELCSLRVNVRVEDSEQMEWLERQIHRVSNLFDDESNGFRCRVLGGLSSPPKACDDSVEPWKRLVEQAANDVGQDLTWGASGGASDGNKLAALGLPNIDTFGPEGGDLHSPTEWLRVSSLPKKAALTLATLVRIGGRLRG